MRQKKDSAEKAVRDIRRTTRRRFAAPKTTQNCWAIRRQPQRGFRLLISTMAAMISGEGPLEPGLPRRFGENSCRYFRFTNAA